MAELDPKKQETAEQERTGITEEREEEAVPAKPEQDKPPRRQPANRAPRRQTEDNNDGKKPWRRISKTLAFWIIFLLVAISASKFLGSNTTNDEVILSYKEYKQFLNDGKISSAVIIEMEFHGRLVEPEFTTPDKGPPRSYDSFTVNLGVIDAEADVIEQYNAIIRLCDGVDYVTQDICIRCLADEETHKVEFEGFLKEYENGQ